MSERLGPHSIARRFVVPVDYPIGGTVDMEIEVGTSAFRWRQAGARRWEVTPWNTVFADLEAGQMSDAYRSLFRGRRKRR